MRFSGHETFAVRYSWLPKAYRYLNDNTPGLQDENAAMVALGLGKNMVRALRFWVEVFGLAADTQRGHLSLTPLAHAIFGRNGHDPYLEDVRTLWLLHWQVSVRPHDPLCAWDVLINRWPRTEFTKSEAVATFHEASADLGGKIHSPVTLAQHFDVFIRTYVPGRAGASNVEESLDSPLAELDLIRQVGERRSGPDGRAEAVYAFRRDVNPDVTPEMFSYFVEQTFQLTQQGENTRTFRDLLVGPYAPGQVLRLTEEDLHERLEALAARDPRYAFQLSAVQSVLQRKPDSWESAGPKQQASFGESLNAFYGEKVALS